MIGFNSDRNNAATYAKLGRIDRDMRRAIRAGWFSLGQDLRKEANEATLKKPKGGRTYIIRTRSGRRRRHTASAPGESHANRFGDLRKSLGWKVHGWESMDFGYGADNRQLAPFYARFVEDGTSRMRPRPTLRNAIGDTQRNAETGFSREMLKIFRRAP